MNQKINEFVLLTRKFLDKDFSEEAKMSTLQKELLLNKNNLSKKDLEDSFYASTELERMQFLQAYLLTEKYLKDIQSCFNPYLEYFIEDFKIFSKKEKAFKEKNKKFFCNSRKDVLKKMRRFKTIMGISFLSFIRKK